MRLSTRLTAVRPSLRAAAAALIVGAMVLAGGPAFCQERLLRIMAMSTDADLSELRRVDALVDALVRADDLIVSSRQPDLSLEGRVHESLMQFHEGVPVHGGGVSRQLASGVTVSIFGTVHENLDVDTTPRLTPDEALEVIEQRANAGPATDDTPTLVVLPTMLGPYSLAWRATMRDRKTYFVDAHTGVIVQDESEAYEQDAAVGVGFGIRGQRKKLSGSSVAGTFRAHDRLRPAEIVTLDLRHNDSRFDSLLDPRGARWTPSDVASDVDNRWNDAAVVDAHVYSGFTYDYLARQGWHGMNGRNGRLLTMTNLRFENAFFIGPPFGPEKTGVVAFGQLRDGTPLVEVDTVAHEIMHGVTHFSVWRRTGERGGLLNTHRYIKGPSRFTVNYGGGATWTAGCGYRYRKADGDCYVCGRLFHLACEDGRLLLFANHGGAVNEAYSDIIGTAVEFSVHTGAGRSGPLRADYLIGEDSGVVIRSLKNPRSIRLSEGSSLRYPDVYSGTVRFLLEVFPDRQEALYSSVGSVDGGRRLVPLPSYAYSGVHWNSTILSHTLYLAIEGGRNATTGRTVRGVGGENRLQVERAFFRAMVRMMPAATSLPMTAAVVRQSAVDLFGAGSATYRAIHDAFRAVGL